MLSKETFGTSGVRIKARLFGGWDLPDLCSSNDMIAEAYEQAVPMGGVLPEGGGATAPTLFVSAIADPGASDHPGTPLQRIQIIKGWVGDDGLFHERVSDVAGDPDNGADVSRDTCALSGAGAASLCATWTDPEFDPSRSAVYYARVLENPSCRWNALQCAALPEQRTPGGLRRSRPAVADPGAGLDLTDLVPRQRPATSRPHNEPNPGSAALKSIRSLFATAASLLLAASVGAQVSTASRWTAVAGIRTWERGRPRPHPARSRKAARRALLNPSVHAPKLPEDQTADARESWPRRRCGFRLAKRDTLKTIARESRTPTMKEVLCGTHRRVRRTPRGDARPSLPARVVRSDRLRRGGSRRRRAGQEPR